MSKFLRTFTKLILILLCHQLLIINAAQTRIVGGKPTTINRNKYMVSLRSKDGRFFCGGSLVKKRYVVTAAHCVDDITKNDFTVHGGVTYLNQKGVKRSVESIIVPRAFNMKNMTMDLAVLKLSKPMQGKNIATIPLCTHKLHVGDWVKISGWGITDENAASAARQLRTTQVRMISPKKCRQQYRRYMKLSRTMICASVPGKRDSCSGDSGGPLVHRGQLCGIVSFGIGCARKNYPGVYTSVNVVKKIILNSMK